MVELSPQPDLGLSVSLGAVEAELDLGGLRLAELRLEAGASRTVVRFSQPNPIRCRTADISAGAAEVSILKLGNSRCDQIRVEGGIGRMTLDFGGAWTGSQRAELSLAVTELRLRLPRKAGVRITMDRLLTSFDHSGLVRRGNEWVTPGYDQAERHGSTSRSPPRSAASPSTGPTEARRGRRLLCFRRPAPGACMSPLETLGFTLGTSFASGLNLYATVATAGLLDRFGIIHLPPSLAVLAQPVVWGIALALFVVEFFADKIPLVDTAWDTLHTFIRPPAAALLAYASFAQVPEPWKICAALLAGDRGAHLAWRQGDDPGRGEHEPGAVQQLDSERGWRMRVGGRTVVARGHAPDPHRRPSWWCW